MENYALGLYEKSMPGELGLEQKLVEAGCAEFDYLELSIDESEEKLARLKWGGAEIRDLVEAQRFTGIPIKSICLSGHRRFPLGSPQPEARARSLEIMSDAIRLAAALGVRLIQLAGYDVYYEAGTPETRRLFAEGLALSVEMAAREGVTLAFETMETEFMNSVAKAMAWVEALDSPYLQVYPDLGNVTNAALQEGRAPIQDLERGRGHLVALHLKETRPGIFREVPYGQGHVDFPPAIAAALGLGVRMFVGEFWHDGAENWREVLRAQQGFLSAAMRKGLELAGRAGAGA